jgi:predicted alpha/beta-hydrolase family hydrolase
VAAPDLRAAAAAARDRDVTVALVEQPYRVAGRRSAAPARQLDAAWEAVIAHLRDEAGDLPMITGGRSSGARVACRTAASTGASGVLCLAFPLQPPPRKSGTGSDSRLPELDGVKVPTLVVQGTNDRFGMPPAGTRRTVVEVRGDHGLKSDLPAVQDAVGDWLGRLLEG